MLESKKQTEHSYLNPTRLSPRYIVLKLSKIKDKERILKTAKEKKEESIKESPLGYLQTSKQKLYKPEENGNKYSNY